MGSSSHCKFERSPAEAIPGRGNHLAEQVSGIPFQEFFDGNSAGTDNERMFRTEAIIQYRRRGFFKIMTYFCGMPTASREVLPENSASEFQECSPQRHGRVPGNVYQGKTVRQKGIII